MNQLKRIEFGITLVNGFQFCMNENTNENGKLYYPVYKSETNTTDPAWQVIKIFNTKKQAIKFIQDLLNNKGK